MEPKYVYIDTALVLHDKFSSDKKYAVVGISTPEDRGLPKDEQSEEPVIYEVIDDAGEVVGVFADNCKPAEE